jgi:hypothetical protein
MPSSYTSQDPRNDEGELLGDFGRGRAGRVWKRAVLGPGERLLKATGPASAVNQRPARAAFSQWGRIKLVKVPRR